MSGEHCAGKTPDDMRVARVDLRAGANGPLYSVRVGSKAQLDVDIMPGQIPVEPLPALDLCGNTVAYARNITDRIDDAEAGLMWYLRRLLSNTRTIVTGSDL